MTAGARSPNFDRLVETAEALRPLLPDLVFVGGSIAEMLVGFNEDTSPDAPTCRWLTPDQGCGRFKLDVSRRPRRASHRQTDGTTPEWQPRYRLPCLPASIFAFSRSCLPGDQVGCVRRSRQRRRADEFGRRRHHQRDCRGPTRSSRSARVSPSADLCGGHGVIPGEAGNVQAKR